MQIRIQSKMCKARNKTAFVLGILFIAQQSLAYDDVAVKQALSLPPHECWPIINANIDGFVRHLHELYDRNERLLNNFGKYFSSEYMRSRSGVVMRMIQKSIDEPIAFLTGLKQQNIVPSASQIDNVTFKLGEITRDLDCAAIEMLLLPHGALAQADINDVTSCAKRYLNGKSSTLFQQHIWNYLPKLEQRTAESEQIFSEGLYDAREHNEMDICEEIYRSIEVMDVQNTLLSVVKFVSDQKEHLSKDVKILHRSIISVTSHKKSWETFNDAIDAMIDHQLVDWETMKLLFRAAMTNHIDYGLSRQYCSAAVEIFTDYQSRLDEIRSDLGIFNPIPALDDTSVQVDVLTLTHVGEMATKKFLKRMKVLYKSKAWVEMPRLHLKITKFAWEADNKLRAEVKNSGAQAVRAHIAALNDFGTLEAKMLPMVSRFRTEEPALTESHCNKWIVAENRSEAELSNWTTEYMLAFLFPAVESVPEVPIRKYIADGRRLLTRWEALEFINETKTRFMIAQKNKLPIGANGADKTYCVEYFHKVYELIKDLRKQLIPRGLYVPLLHDEKTKRENQHIQPVLEELFTNVVEPLRTIKQAEEIPVSVNGCNNVRCLIDLILKMPKDLFDESVRDEMHGYTVNYAFRQANAIASYVIYSTRFDDPCPPFPEGITRLMLNKAAAPILWQEKREMFDEAKALIAAAPYLDSYRKDFLLKKLEAAAARFDIDKMVHPYGQLTAKVTRPTAVCRSLVQDGIDRLQRNLLPKINAYVYLPYKYGQRLPAEETTSVFFNYPDARNEVFNDLWTVIGKSTDLIIDDLLLMPEEKGIYLKLKSSMIDDIKSKFLEKPAGPEYVYRMRVNKSFERGYAQIVEMSNAYLPHDEMVLHLAETMSTGEFWQKKPKGENPEKFAAQHVKSFIQTVRNRLTAVSSFMASYRNGDKIAKAQAIVREIDNALRTPPCPLLNQEVAQSVSKWTKMKKHVTMDSVNPKLKRYASECLLVYTSAVETINWIWSSENQ